MSRHDDQDAREPESCLPDLHRWRPLEISEPTSLTAFAGIQCYCGLRMLMVHACECGNEHLRQVQVGAVKIGGR